MKRVKIKTWIGILLAVILAGIAIFAFVKSCQRNLIQHKAVSLPRQLEIADSLADASHSEEALASYHFISESWEDIAPHDTESAHAALTASLLEAQLCFNKYSDYGRELLALNRGEKIAKRFNLSTMGVNFLLASLYCTIAQQNNAPDYFNKAADYYVKVLEDDSDDTDKLRHYAATNLILFADKSNIREKSQQALAHYFNIKFPEDEIGEQVFNRRIQALMQSVKQKDSNRALALADSLRLNPSIPSERVLPGIYFIAGQSFANIGDYPQAIQYFNLSEERIDPDNGKDMLLEVYEAQADAYSHLGNELLMGQYAMKAGSLRRELTSFAQISALKSAEINDQMTEIQNSLNVEKRNASMWRRWVIFCIVIVVVAGAFIGMLAFFLRRLRENNRTLYNRYLDLLKLTEKGGELISPNADAVDNISAGNEYLEADNEAEALGKTEADHISASSENSQAIPHHINPDADNNADDSNKMAVERIMEVLNNSDEIFKPDFNVATMAALTGLKPRQLSQIIQEHYHTSFRNLINRRRIRSVCLRLETSNAYDNLTVDAIAESIGIKSRTTFTDSFKRETGMTPAQYIKFATERKKRL